MSSRSSVRLLFYFIILVYSQNIICQDFFYDGYIITHSKDTIRGKVKDLGLNKNSLLCTFIPNNSDTISHYRPGEIYAYWVRDQYYIPKHILLENNNIHQFAEILINGVLDLYRVAIDNEPFYLFENADSIQYLIVAQRNSSSTRNDLLEDQKLYNKNLTALRAIMQDYPPVFNQIDKIYLQDKRSVARLVENYHNGVSPDEKYINYTEKERQSDILIGLTSGLYYPVLSFSGDDYFDHLNEAKAENNIAISYGIDVCISVPSEGRRVSFDFIFEKSKEYYKYTYDTRFDAVTNLELNLLSSSLQVNYLLFQKGINLTPYFGSSLISIIDHKETYQIENGYHRNPIAFNNGFVSFNCGINFDLPFHTKKEMVLRTRLGYKANIIPLINYIYLKESYQNISIGLSLFYSL